MIGSLRDIARRLSGEVRGDQVVAPGPGHSPKDRSMTVKLSPAAPNGFVVFSHSNDDFAVCRDYVCERLGLTPERRIPERKPAPKRPLPPGDDASTANRREAFVREQIAAIVRELAPVRGSQAELYLREARAIDTSAIVDVIERTDAIGWHPAVYFNEPGHALDGKRLGAIIGVMTDPVTASPTGAISRTYLFEGRKIGKAKTLSAPAGIVRLSHDEDVLEGLHLAEGLETALAAMAKGFRPIWATGSTAAMAKFPLLAGIEALTIFVDHDRNGAGEKAAREAEARWRGAGKDVRLLQADAFGDLNDVIAGDAT
jgi:putative DNA primase/helicase